MYIKTIKTHVIILLHNKRRMMYIEGVISSSNLYTTCAVHYALHVVHMTVRVRTYLHQLHLPFHHKITHTQTHTNTKSLAIESGRDVTAYARTLSSTGDGGAGDRRLTLLLPVPWRHRRRRGAADCEEQAGLCVAGGGGGGLR